jgi:hypothetical protein
MTVLWTQVKKDVRSIRWILLVWLVIEVGLAVLVGSGVDARLWDARTIGMVNLEHRTAMWCAEAVFVLVAVWLVQADPLVGSTAFWLTRPVGRSTMLASKAIVAVVFLVAVPLVLDGTVFLTSGVTSRDLWQAAAQQLVGQLLYLLPVMAVAALTPNLGRFALGSAIGIAAWLAMAAVIVERGGFPGHRPGGAVVAGLLVGVTLMCLTCLAVVVHQFLTRRTHRSLFVGGAGFAGVLAVALIWPWPMPAAPSEGIDVRQFDPASVVLSVGPDDLRLRDVGRMSSIFVGEPSAISFSLEAKAALQVPSGFEVRQAQARTTLRFADGTTLQSGNYGSYLVGGMEDLDQPDMIRHVLGPVRVVYSRPQWSPPRELSLLEIPAASMKAHGDQKARCKADLVLGVWTDRVVAEAPARAGARFRYGRFWQGEILDAALERGAIVIRTRESGVLHLQNHDYDFRSYLLVNKARGQAIVSIPTFTVLFWPPYPQVPTTGTLDVRHQTLEFGTYDARDRDFSVNQAWLDGASLVVIEKSRIGTFTRSIDFGDIVLASLPRR